MLHNALVRVWFRQRLTSTLDELALVVKVVSICDVVSRLWYTLSCLSDSTRGDCLWLLDYLDVSVLWRNYERERHVRCPASLLSFLDAALPIRMP